jgi:hypothetical protein
MSQMSTGLSRQEKRARPSSSVAPLAVSPLAASRLLSIGISSLYGLLRAGELDSFHCGRMRRITTQSITDYVARQLAIANKTPGRPTSLRRGKRLQAAKTAAPPKHRANNAGTLQERA